MYFLADFQLNVLRTLDRIENQQQDQLSLITQIFNVTRGAGGDDMVEDLVVAPNNYVDELTELCDKLGDQQFRKKLVNKCVDGMCDNNNLCTIDLN